MTETQGDMENHTVVENYLSLSRGDRAAVYRRLSVADRMRLDRCMKQRKVEKKNTRKRSKASGPETHAAFDEQSPWLATKFLRLLSDQESGVGEKTLAYIRVHSGQGHQDNA